MKHWNFEIVKKIMDLTFDTKYLVRFGIATLIPLSLVACSDGGTAPPAGVAPRITVTGVSEGDSITDSVTIDIAVDRGSFQATLNGNQFFSGRVVRDPDNYLLHVDAQSGEATATLDLNFTITFAGQSILIIRFIDLGDNNSGGGGDAVLVTDSSSAGMRHALLDAGPGGASGSDPGLVARRLASLGVDTLQLLVLSHAHTDHFNGMPSVLAVTKVQQFFYNGQVRTFSGYTSFINQATAAADLVTVPSSVVESDLGFGSAPTRIAILSPLDDFLSNSSADGSQINEGSLAVEIRKGNFQMLFTGDGEVRANQRWRTQFPVRTGGLTILKVGHHGANDAVFDNGFNGSSSWLIHTSPDVAVVSANGRSHGRVNAINHLIGLTGVALYCTNVHGEIEVRVSESGQWVIQVEKNAGQPCVPGSEAIT